MIKFFRHIRKSLLMENKTSKYFKYAIGEILLVVIGILIAVGINSKYQERENIKKVNAILVQIQKELSIDIIDAKRILQEYYNKSFYSDKIFNNKLTIEDMNSPELAALTFRYVSFSTNKTAYQRLINNLEILPENYENLLPDLNYLYVEMQNDIDDYNKDIKRITSEVGENQLTTTPELSEWIKNNDVTSINTNFTKQANYKNWIYKYLHNFFNITQASSDYKTSAIKTYKKIDSILQKESDSQLNFLKTINTTSIDFEDYYGTFVHENNEQIHLSRKNNNLMIKENEKQLTSKLWLHDKNIYFTEELTRIIELTEDEKGEKILTDYNGFSKEVYYKLKE